MSDGPFREEGRGMNSRTADDDAILSCEIIGNWKLKIENKRTPWRSENADTISIELETVN